MGLGHLRLAPDVFWRMSLVEFFAACDGYLESQGVRPASAGARDAPSRAEMDALFACVDAEGRWINRA